jgi:hypothetical protein
MIRFALLVSLLAAAPSLASEHTVLGLKLDGGVPDGAGLSLLVRPLSFLRFEAGATTDLAAPGARGGITVSVPWYISPSLTAEAGHQFPGDMNGVIARFSGTNPALSVLRRFSYSYANLHAGLEFGNPNRVMFTIHAGYSYFVSTTDGLSATLNKENSQLSSQGEATVRVWAPSAKVGLLFYIW